MIRIRIWEELTRLQITGNYLPKTDHLFFQKTLDLIVEHLLDPSFRTKELASKMGISDSQLYRRVKAKTKKSTAIYCRSIRLQIARELLLSTNLNISEIAYRTGFNDPSYFARTFHVEFGATPSSIRGK